MVDPCARDPGCVLPGCVLTGREDPAWADRRIATSGAYARGAARAGLLLLACLALAPAIGCARAAEDAAPARAAELADAGARDPVTGLRQGQEAGFARADRPRPFVFPLDHGPHPAFRTEWWYFTGHLSADDGRRYGFQYTVFRQALRPPAPADHTRDASRWRTDTAWLAHLALTDIDGARHDARARIARGALGLGGARWSPDGALALEVDGWSLTRAPGGEFTLAADAAAGAVDGPALQLRLTPRAAVLAQGDQGLSRKGPNAASYYYSIPRWSVRGAVRDAAGVRRGVHGDAWLDREWSTSELAPEQIGWDWFSLNLDDGGDLMLFRLRRRDGARDPFDAGTYVKRGQVLRLRAADFEATPLAHWTDERGRAWPVRWRLRVPRAGLDVEVRALVQDQLMRVGFEYWEGAVEVRGGPGGRGYLEMTGVE